MATRSAGRVTIRVIPDSTSFRRDLKTALERVQRTTKAVIPAELAVTRESIAKLRAQLRELEVRIKVDPYITKEDLRRVKDDLEDLDPNVNVGVNTLVARARLAALTRPRTATIFVRINKASLAAAAQALAALSGARFLGNVFDKFWDSIKNIDKSAPRIALLSSGIVALSGVLGAAVSNMAGLAVSVAQLGQAAVLLPALLTGAGISIGVLIAAFKDMKEVLKDLGPSFNKLQDIISKNFWDQAAQPIRDLTNNLMPTLNIKLGELASAWGRLFKQLAISLQDTVTPDKLSFMMDNLTRSIEIARQAVDPLVRAFTRLGEFGSQYLPRLSEWLVRLSDQFNNFVQKAADDGKLEKWAETGIRAFKDLGRVIKETVRVFAALSRAATVAGGSGFAQLADGLKKLADTMNTANFQTTFITILASAHDVVDGLIDGLNRLGPGLANFAPTIARVFDQVGKVLGQVGEDIAALLSVPELQSGIEHMFSGLLTFVTDLKPAMEPLGQIIGTLADIIGTLLSYFGLLLADVAPYFATFFKDVWNAVKPLLPTLTDLVRDLLPPFAEILTVLAREVLPELVPIIKELAPVFTDLVVAFAPVLVQFLKDFAAGLKAVQPGVKPVADAIKTLSDNFKGLPLAFYQKSTGNDGGFLGTMAKFMTEHPTAAAYLTGIGTAVGIVGQQLKNFGDGLGFLTWVLQMGAALHDPKSITTGVVNLAAGIVTLVTQQGAWEGFWNTIGGILGMISPIGPAFQIMVSAVQGGVAVVQTLTGPWGSFWTNLPNPVQSAVTLVTGTLNIGGVNWLSSITRGWAMISSFWTINWPTLLPTVSSTMTNIAGSVSGGFPGILVSVIGGMASVGSQFARGWQNIVNEIPGWFNRMVGGVGWGILRVVGETSTLPGRIISGLMTGLGSMFNAGYSLMSNFAAGISSGGLAAIGAVGAVIGRIVAQLPGSPAKEGPLSGRGWSKIRGQHLLEDMAAGMKSRTDMLQTQANAAAHAMALDASGASWASVRSVGDTSTAGALVNIEGDYYGATPAEVAEDFDKKIRRANTVYKLTGVK